MARNRRQNGARGNALVDFAVSTVVILTALFGIIDVGRALYAYDWVAHAARQGARFMIVRGTFCANNPVQLPGGCPATGKDCVNYITNANGNGLDTTGIDTSQVTVTTGCLTGAVFAPPPCAPSYPVQVKVQYNFKFLSPFVPLSWSMQSTSKVIVQN